MALSLAETIEATMTESPSGAEIAIAALESHGVEVVFGIPGVHTLALYDAIRASGLRHVLSRHEQGVGFMADGYARATGKPGVAVVITGPGVTNIATPIGEAYTDSSPVLVLSSNVERAHLDDMRGNLHDLKDQRGVMAAVTKWNTRVMHADEVWPALDMAFTQLMTGRPLPVHVEIPLDVLDERTDRPARSTSEPNGLAPVPEELIEEAVSQLKSARRPVIYCGGGAVSSGASEAITRLAELLNAPVVTSIMGKGSIPEDHPLSLGALWSPGNEIDELIRQADLMIVFGSKLGAQATYGFQLPIPPALIRVDIDPRELTLNARPTLPILGDTRLVSDAIVGLLSNAPGSSSEHTAESIASARKSGELGAWHAERRDHVDALRRAIPRDGILVTDMTQMSYVATGLYEVYEPRTYMFPSGYGTLGFSLPAAIGAKVGKPDAMVVCVIGDGGFQYTMGELGCAVQERLGIPIVIFNDSTYSAVKEAQLESRGGRYIAVDLVNPDYVELAKAYGIPGVRATSPDMLEREILQAAERDLPTIIDVPIDPWV
jgi:thiamine pyrophosphate-dependent acetolactate synthase large subunit-like protein